MRAIVFAYHNMGIIGLEALMAHGYRVPLVVTHVDDPDERRWYGSVAEWCSSHGVEVRIVDDVNSVALREAVRNEAPDFIFSFYCRHLLGAPLLAIPARGALNLHGSLLPNYRGCAPVNWVLVNGEAETGVTLHYMVEEADAGDIVGHERVRIGDEDTVLMLYRKIESAAKMLLDRELPKLLNGTASRTPQDASLASRYRRRGPGDGAIDWKRSAREIYNLVRAVTDPYPGAFGYLGSEKVIIWRAAVEAASGLAPGEVRTDASAVVGTGAGSLVLHEVERAGKRYRDGEVSELLRMMCVRSWQDA